MSEAHDRLAALFNQARRLPPEERAGFLARTCPGDGELRAEVESLLGHDSEGPLDRAEQAVAAEMIELGSGPDSLPKAIGDYRILNVIGAGGMGIVYEAEQSKPQRRVALKVIRTGLASAGLLRRFEHEAEVLGWLDHPGIARIYEAGMADAGTGPQPYFAMELVRGQTIGRYAESAGLDTHERLALIARVADAVHHAHQKGVVHRDLKPANVLVDASGQPKVLDFGVARVTDADLKSTTVLTNAGELVGTLPYMSPEQVAGDPSELDARSDVYALGVIAYELLSGQLPHDVSALPLPEAARRIAQEEPTTLSVLDRRFRGDVEIIVGKALAGEKDRRYGSAEELAHDIRRHLADEPITARPPSGMYQLAKFARRNRALVAGIALAFVALAIGAVTSTVQFLDARAGWKAEKEQRERAEENLEAADRVSEFLVQLFEIPDTSEDWGNAITARELLDRGARDIASELADQPRIRARLMGTMGQVYGNLGVYEEARPLLEEAVALHRAGAEDESLAGSLYLLGIVERSAGDYDAAAKHLQEACDIALRLGGEEHELYATALGGLAGLQALTGEYESAVSNAARVRAIQVARHGARSNQATLPLTTLASVHHMRDEWPEALAAANEVLEIRRELLDGEHPDLIRAMSLKGTILQAQGELEEAIALAREVYEIKTRRLEENHPGHVQARYDLAVMLGKYGEVRESEELLLDVRERERALRGEKSPTYASLLNSLGKVQWDLSRFPESEANLREALAIRTEMLGEEHLDTISTLNTLGTMLAHGPRRYAEAIEFLERALELSKQELGGLEKATVSQVMGNLASAYAFVGRYDEAEEMQLKLLELYRELRGPDHEDVSRTLHNLSMLVFSRGNYEQALEYAVECGEVQKRGLPPGHHLRGYNLDAIARCYLKLERMEEAEATFRESLSLREAALPEGHVSTAESHAMLAYCLQERGAFEEAEPLLLESMEACFANYPPGHTQRKFVVSRVQNLYRKWGKDEEADGYLERIENGDY